MIEYVAYQSLHMDFQEAQLRVEPSSHCSGGHIVVRLAGGWNHGTP